MRRRKHVIPVYEESGENVKGEEDSSALESKELLALESKGPEAPSRSSTSSESEESSDEEKTKEIQSSVEKSEYSIRKFVEEVQTRENVQQELNSRDPVPEESPSDPDPKSNQPEDVPDPKKVETMENSAKSDSPENCNDYIPSKLSEIRQEMKSFRTEMSKFDLENNIKYKNGQIESFWVRENGSKSIEPISVDSATPGRTEESLTEPLQSESKLSEESLRARMLLNMRSTKSDESMEKNRKSADNLMKISRKAMAEGQSTNPLESAVNHSKIDNDIIVETITPIDTIGDCQGTRKSLEMRLALRDEETK